MKKLLLGTTAVVAATALGGAAFAQSASEPIKLGLGGYWVGGAGDRISGAGALNSETHNQGFEKDSAIYVKGETKFDNGLGVGVMWQLRGEGANSAGKVAGSSPADTVKRSYVRFFGSFGEVRFGDDDDSRLQKAVDAPQAGAIFGVNSPYLQFNNAPGHSLTTQNPVGKNKRAHRIAYFSPTVAGFSFAASYAPEDQKGTFNSPNGFVTSQAAGAFNNEASIAAAYDNKFGDFHLTAASGFTWAHIQGSGTPGPVTTGAPNPFNQWAWDGGVNLGFGPITVGSSYEHFKNANQGGLAAGNQSNNTWDVGAVYQVGPFSASLNWGRSLRKGLVTANATSTLDIYEAIVDYVLGPGVAIGAAVEWDKYHSGVTATASGAGGLGNATQNVNSTSLEVGTHFTF